MALPREHHRGAPLQAQPLLQCEVEPMNEVVVYSKTDCHLCDEVKAQLRKLEKSHAFKWREVNILEDQDAFQKFSEQVPVVFVNGKKAFKYHLDEEEFLKCLRAGGQ